MTRLTPFLLAAAIVASPLHAQSADDPDQTTDQPDVTAMIDYPSARAAIANQGWKPVKGGCAGVSQDTCHFFPEIVSCLDDDPGLCVLAFEMHGACLNVFTTGGPPGSEGTDTRVTNVTTGKPVHGRCVVARKK